MSDNRIETGIFATMVIRSLLIVALIMSLIMTYAAFRILPEEVDIRGPGISARDAQKTSYRISDSQMGQTAIDKREVIDTSGYKIRPPSWRVNAYIDRAGKTHPDIIIKVFGTNDRLIAPDDFSAKIVMAGHEDKSLPGVEFKAVKDGHYKASSVNIPDEGEWEIRASLRREMQTILVEQRIDHLPEEDTAGDE